MLTNSLKHVVVARSSDVGAVIGLHKHESAAWSQQPHHFVEDSRR